MIKCVNENCDYYNEHGECSSVCENNGFTRIFTNYDRIRNMSVEELARFLAEQVMKQEEVRLIEKDTTATHIEYLKSTLFRGYLRYLESEVEGE